MDTPYFDASAPNAIAIAPDAIAPDGTAITPYFDAIDNLTNQAGLMPPLSGTSEPRWVTGDVGRPIPIIYSDIYDGSPQAFKTPLSPWNGCTSTAAVNGSFGPLNEIVCQSIGTANISNTYDIDSHTDAPSTNTQFPPVWPAGSEASPIFGNPASGILQTHDVAYGFGEVFPANASALVEQAGLSETGRYRPNHGYGTAGPSDESRKKDFPETQAPGALYCEWRGCPYRHQFSRPNDLIRHVTSVHILPAGFSCRAEGCVKHFGRKDKLLAHMRKEHSSHT